MNHELVSLSVREPKVRVAKAGAHYPALDGVRGLAILAVFLAHYYTMIEPKSQFYWGGWLGVDVFFVLSGFLITGILFDALGRSSFFRTFYTRRALRIFPLYYAPWVVFLLLTPWLHPLWTRFDIARIFYYGNLMDFVSFRHPGIPEGGFMFYLPGGHYTGFNTGILWSLCLEEQFYLIWPLLIFLLRDRVRIMYLCIAGIVASPMINLGLLLWARRAHTTTAFLYDATYCHYSPMLFGALLALWLRGRQPALPVARRLYLTLMIVPSLILVLAIALAPEQMFSGDYLAPLFGYSCSALAACGLLLAALQTNRFSRVLSARWLTAIGTVSYGLYIIHGYLMGAISHHAPAFIRHHVGWMLPVLAFGLVYALAQLSYRYLELPFLRLKRTLAPNEPPALPSNLHLQNAGESGSL